MQDIVVKPWHPYPYDGDKPPLEPVLAYLTLPGFEFNLYDKSENSRLNTTNNNRYSVDTLISRVNQHLAFKADTVWRLPHVSEIPVICKANILPKHLPNATYWLKTLLHGDEFLGHYLSDASYYFRSDMISSARVVLVRNLNE